MALVKRTHDNKISNAILDNVVSNLSYDIKFKQGSEAYPIIKCCLYDNAGHVVSTGYGKGSTNRSRAIAGYEALQHLLANPTLQTVPIIHDSYNSLKSTHTFLKPNVVKELLEEDYDKDKAISWCEFTEYNSRNKAILPLVSTVPYNFEHTLWLDQVDYETKYTQSSDNGIASGAVFYEALYFAILELIERHALSKFLIDTCANNKPYYSINTKLKFISEENNQMLTQLIKKHGLNLELIRIPSPHKLHTTLAILRSRDEKKLPYRGLKTSFDPHESIESAIEELLQDYFISEKFSNRQHLYTLYESLNEHPSLQKTLKLDFSNSKKQRTRIWRTQQTKKVISAEQHCKALVTELYKQEQELYYRIIYQTKGYCLVHAIIPGCQEFSTILFGNISLPS